MKIKNGLILGLVVLCGCATGSVSPGVTLLAGLHHYRDEMETFAGRSERWPERQRMAGLLKTTFTVTMGRSQEFNRLVDLDLRKREFMIAIRDLSLRPEQVKEMKAEVAKMNEEVEGLKGVVRGQIAMAPVQAQEQRIEGVATIGLLTLAIDGFSSANNSAGAAATTKVGPYVITDVGGFSSVRTPEGQTYRCTTFIVQEEGAGIKCEPVAGARS